MKWNPTSCSIKYSKDFVKKNNMFSLFAYAICNIYYPECRSIHKPNHWNLLHPTFYLHFEDVLRPSQVPRYAYAPNIQNKSILLVCQIFVRFEIIQNSPLRNVDFINYSCIIHNGKNRHRRNDIWPELISVYIHFDSNAHSVSDT